MKKIIIFIFIYLISYSYSNALIKVDITRGNLDPLPIAVSPLHVESTSENLENLDYSLINNINTKGITASASAPEILLKNFISYMKINYKIDLHQSENISEDINFNIPKQLEE